MTDIRGSVKETTISGGTTLVSGALYVDADNNTLVVAPSAEKATM